MRVWGLLFVVLIVAGCADGGSPAAASPSVASSAPPVVTSDVGGSIHGLVIDDEALPIASATVGLAGTTFKAETAKNGEFTFNEVPMGAYTVSAAALGYESVSKKLEVKDGEVTEAKITLKAIEVLGEPYINAYHGAYFIVFDWFGVGQTTAIHQTLCTPCDSYQSISPKSSAAYLEGVWTKTIDLPVTSETILFNVYVKPVNNTFVEGQQVVGKSLKSREGVAVGEDGVKLLSKADLVSIQVLSPGLTQVAIQQKVESWFSLGFNGEIPEGYSALAPT